MYLKIESCFANSNEIIEKGKPVEIFLKIKATFKFNVFIHLYAFK